MEFSELEDKAIDGLLNYDDYPPPEYKYFSRLAKLGYLNRNCGWSYERCVKEQQKLYAEYLREKDRRERFYKIACETQANVRAGENMVIKMRKTDNPVKRLEYAEMAIKLMEGRTRR